MSRASEAIGSLRRVHVPVLTGVHQQRVTFRVQGHASRVVVTVDLVVAAKHQRVETLVRVGTPNVSPTTAPESKATTVHSSKTLWGLSFCAVTRYVLEKGVPVALRSRRIGISQGLVLPIGASCKRKSLGGEVKLFVQETGVDSLSLQMLSCS